MAHVIDLDLVRRIRELGAFDINACFNCGNCTAVCPISKEDDNFPRRMVRFAQLGMEERLLSEKNLWLCYYCGECSDTCPRQAEPGEFMASARRYAITRYDPTGISWLMHRSPLTCLVAFAGFSLLFTLLLLWKSGRMNLERTALFEFIPGPFIHDLGIVTLLLVAALTVLGLALMAYRIVKAGARAGRLPVLSTGPIVRALKYAISESLGQRRYRDCEETRSPLYLKPWFVHVTILWGFLGLLAATALDYLFKPIGSPVPPWYPMRILGTLAGAACLYGTSVAILRRLSKPTKYYSHSRFSDWFFLLLLFLTVATGFVVEVAVYRPPSTFSYVILMVHVVLAMDLIVLLPFSKFAHAVYRPLALFMHEWIEQSKAVGEQEDAARQAA